MMVKKARMASLDGELPIKQVQALWRVDSDPTETCPACGAGIPFDDILLAKCDGGHYWGE